MFRFIHTTDLHLDSPVWGNTTVKFPSGATTTFADLHDQSMGNECQTELEAN
jgi:hypothetical protein